jgi:hypothetical protein
MSYEAYAFLIGLATYPILYHVVWPILEKKIHDRFEVKRRGQKRKGQSRKTKDDS